MDTIICNTITGAISEYGSFGFQSVIPTHAGSAVGLYELTGDTDDGALIVSRVLTGKPQWGTSFKKMFRKIFFGLKGTGEFSAIVAGESDEYTYPFTAVATGESRAQPGRGIRETYLAVGFTNPFGQQFQLDNIEPINTTSKDRRV